MADDQHDSLIALLEGVQQFSREVYPANQELFAGLALGQSPHTLFITCADSRISPGMITQNKPGGLFVLRNIGNIVPAYGESDASASAAIEYAVSAIRVDNIVVCGHSDCGAMKAMLHPEKHGLSRLPTVGSWLRNAEAALAVTHAREPGDAEVLADLIRQNVLLQLEHLRTHPAVAARLADGTLVVQGWFYDIGHGAIWVLDEPSRRPLSVPAALARLRGQPEAPDEARV